MIQRIQSLLLLLAGSSFLSLFKLPISTSTKTTELIYNDNQLNLYDDQVLMGLAVAAGIISLIAIFLFKNRKLQTSITAFAIVMGLALTAFGFMTYNSSIPSGLEADINLSTGFFMPILSIVFLIIAIVFIKKDDRLVQSMDRLR